MNPIKVIDAPCGAGKTSWAIQEMKRNEDTSYVYCTPFLKEIDRVKDGTANINGQWRFKEPEYYIDTGDDCVNCCKINSFNYLLARGEDIAVTHTTFLNATQETLDNIQQGEYTLILDEALEAVQEFNEIQEVSTNVEQKLSPIDIENLKADGHITIDPTTRRVSWVGSTWDGGKFSVLEKMAKSGRVFYVNQRVMVCIYPPEIFKAFKNVYVMTYMFGGSQLKAYFDLFNIEYEMCGIEMSQDNEYQLCEYNIESDFSFRDHYRELIKFVGESIYNGGNLSKTWYQNAGEDNLAKLKGKIKYNLTKQMGAKASDIMWTCPKDYQSKLSGKGYTEFFALIKNEKTDLSGDENSESNLKEEPKKIKVSCFVPCNARATNDYKNRWALAYCCNMYPRREINNFFASQGITMRQDIFALSCLIQWICRSRIRDGQAIEIYLPSKRMRSLLERWLNHEVWE